MRTFPLSPQKTLLWPVITTFSMVITGFSLVITFYYSQLAYQTPIKQKSLVNQGIFTCSQLAWPFLSSNFFYYTFPIGFVVTTVFASIKLHFDVHKKQNKGLRSNLSKSYSQGVNILWTSLYFELPFLGELKWRSHDSWCPFWYIGRILRSPFWASTNKGCRVLWVC